MTQTRTVQRGLSLLSKHGTETGFCIGTGKLPSIEFAEGTSSQLIRRITGERTAELQDNPPASLVYMTGLEAVTFLEVIRAGYVHELTIFEPYLPDKGGYSCIYTRYGAGSRDAMSEHYVGVARPL